MKVACHNCASDRLSNLYRCDSFDDGIGEFEISRCELCGLVNTIGVSEEDLVHAYSAEYYGSATAKFAGVIESFLKTGEMRRARKIMQLWSADRGETANPSILDIGCGRGNLLTACQSMGASVLGFERQEFTMLDVQKEFIHQASLSDPTYSSRRFDIVVIWHALEHLDAQDALFEEISAHMNPDGLLVIAVPHYGSLQQRLFGRDWFHLDLPRHLVHIEKVWLLTRLSRFGAGRIKVSTLDVNQQLFGFIQSALNKVFPNHPNELYSLLRTGLGLKHLYRLGFWLCSAMLFLPFALAEAAASVLLGKGATLICYARINSSDAP